MTHRQTMAGFGATKLAVDSRATDGEDEHDQKNDSTAIAADAGEISGFGGFADSVRIY
jgi:hypothetical protein